MTKQRIFILISAIVAGFLLAGILVLVKKSQMGMGSSSVLHPVTADAFGGPFTLTDHTGKKVTEKNFQRKYRLIYFGFTYCPAICPTELAKITSALNMVGDNGRNIQPLFITIDPERDNVDSMGKYVSLFHPSLIGLTGTPEEIKAAAKAYKIYYAKVQDDSMSDYTMDHSSFIYFIAPDDRLLQIFRMEDDATQMADAINRWLSQEQKQQ